MSQTISRLAVGRWKHGRGSVDEVRIEPERYRTVVLVAGASLAAIVLTGAAVRLTEAGLGCENWPACSDERIVPELALHPWIEFGNRLLSGLVAVAVILAVLSAYRRQPRRQDLTRWAWGLVAGVTAQIVLGGVTVRVDLHPALVGMHFLLSMVLLWNAVVLWVRASAGDAAATPLVDSTTVLHSRIVVALSTGVLVTGTLVTGTGPNSGDSRAERLQFELEAIAQVHSAVVWFFLASVVTLALRLARGQPAGKAARWLVAAILAQGAIGYLQYAIGVPPLLVELHILGAIVVWCTTLLVHLQLFDRTTIESGIEGVTSPPILARMEP